MWKDLFILARSDTRLEQPVKVTLARIHCCRGTFSLGTQKSLTWALLLNLVR